VRTERAEQHGEERGDRSDSRERHRDPPAR
jgi:hypothetical protein